MTNQFTSTPKQTLLERLLASPNKALSTKEGQRILACKPHSFYHASYAQNRIYILHQLAKDSLNYNLPLATLIEGKIDYKRFDNAIKQLINRHQALRTSFQIIDGELVQIIDEESNLRTSIQEIEESEIPSLLKNFAQPFDLATAPLIHISLIKFSLNRYLLLLDMHHIISDGTSLNILIEDFLKLYSGQEITKLLIQHKDYAAWEIEWFKSDAAKKQLTFWKNQLENLAPPLALPIDYSRPMAQSYQGNSILFKFSKDLSTKLKNIVNQTNTTLFVLLLSIYKIFLYKLSGQNDIVTGTPIAGRGYAELQKIVGLFINTLAIRVRIDKELTFDKFITYMHETVTDCLDHQQYPFEKIIEQLDLKRDTSRNPVFDTMFTMQNMQRASVKNEDLTFKPYPLEYKIANFDLELYAYEAQEEISFRLEYSTDLFTSDTAWQITSYFKTVAEEIANCPTIKLSKIKIISTNHSINILKNLRGDTKNIESKSFQSIFEDICKQYPNKVSVTFNDQKLTYDQLNQAANKLAHQLIKIGAHPEGFICLVMDRSINFLISMLAILKSGAVYVPIDPVLPQDRMRLIINNMPGCIVLTDHTCFNLFESLQLYEHIYYLEDLLKHATVLTNPPLTVHPKNLAYVIFTSGSTGAPKGAMVEHMGMVNHLYAKVIDLKLTHEDVIAQNATQSFDVSVWQFLVGLIVGGTVVIFDKNSAWEPQKLVTLIQHQNVTVFETVPSHMLIILDLLEQITPPPNIFSLRWMIVNGEPLSSDICQRWFKLYNHIPMLNAYGPTECSDDVTHHKIFNCVSKESPSLPIGKTIINHTLYILDDSLQLVPPGTIGELYVSGNGVGRGYLNSPGKTATTYLPDLFSIEPGKRMYRTGDLVRYLNTTGDIIFLGRKDNQIKVRGYRIELEEIERAILAFPPCKECLVTIYKESDDIKSICAYVKLQESNTKDDLKNHLARMLPHYMLPTYIELIDHFPLLINGKIDRHKLPIPTPNTPKVIFIAPTTSLEKSLQKLWSEILVIPENKISITQNFFELGGTSLKAIKLISRIQVQLGFNIPFTDIFKYPTISEMANYKSIKDNLGYINLHQYAPRSLYPATFEQKQLYIENQKYRNETVYNMPYILTIMGSLDIQRALECLLSLSERHDILRMGFTKIGSDVYLKEHENIEFTIEYLTASKTELDDITMNFIRPYNLEVPPLIRLTIVNVGDENIMLLDCHAIAADLISRQILVRDFFNLYLGNELPEQSISYKDYLIWKHNLFNSDHSVLHQQYWQKILSTSISQLKSHEWSLLKENSPISAVRTTTYWDEALLRKLEQLASRLEVTPHVLCFAFFAVLLERYSDQKDFCIISPVAERDHPNLENLVGMLVNTLPIVVQPSEPGLNFIKFVNILKHRLLDAYSHQHYPAHDLYNQQILQNNEINQGYFDATFVWGENQEKSFSDMTSRIKERSIENLPPRFDFRLEAYLSNNRLKLMLESRATLFSLETIQIMIESIKNIFQQVEANPTIKIMEINL